MGYSERCHTVVRSYRKMFKLPFNTKQRLERVATDVRREMNDVVLHSFAADSV